MTWRETIIHVLKTSGVAMHYVDIAGEIMGNGLVDTQGATPHQTVSRELTTSINTEGANSPFVRIQPGYYKLRQGYQGDEQPDNQDIPDDDGGGDSIVTSFGMYWNRADVIWQRSPRLLGSQHENADPIDFCDQTGVYLLYNYNQVIYVGRSEEALGTRLYAHTRDRLKGRWNQFSWFGFRPIADDGTLEPAPVQYANPSVIPDLEAVLIEACEPGQNRRRGDDFSAIEYIQVGAQQ